MSTVVLQVHNGQCDRPHRGEGAIAPRLRPRDPAAADFAARPSETVQRIESRRLKCASDESVGTGSLLVRATRRQPPGGAPTGRLAESWGQLKRPVGGLGCPISAGIG